MSQRGRKHTGIYLSHLQWFGHDAVCLVLLSKVAHGGNTSEICSWKRPGGIRGHPWFRGHWAPQFLSSYSNRTAHSHPITVHLNLPVEDHFPFWLQIVVTNYRFKIQVISLFTINVQYPTGQKKLEHFLGVKMLNCTFSILLPVAKSTTDVFCRLPVEKILCNI